MAGPQRSSMSKNISECPGKTAGQPSGAHQNIQSSPPPYGVDAYEMRPIPHLPDPESFKDISFMLSPPAPAPAPVLSPESFNLGFYKPRKDFRTILLCTIALLVIAIIVSSTVLGLKVGTLQAGVQNRNTSTTPSPPTFSMPTKSSPLLAIRQLSSTTTTQTSVPAGGVFTARPTITTSAPSSSLTSSSSSATSTSGLTPSILVPTSSSSARPAQQTLIFSKPSDFILPGRTIQVFPIGAVMVGIWTLIFVGVNVIGVWGRIQSRKEYRERVAMADARDKAHAEIEGWEMRDLGPRPVVRGNDGGGGSPAGKRPVTMRGALGEVWYEDFARAR